MVLPFRAAELAASRVQMPRLAEDLLKEKNCELDGLRARLQVRANLRYMLVQVPPS